MNRETRNNLIFIALLLAVCLPGGIILFKKKSQPGARPIGALDTVRTETAYVNPTPYGSKLSFTVPPQTDQWVAKVGSADGFPKVAIDAHKGRLISKARLFQIVRQEKESDGLHLTLIIWNPEVPVPTPVVNVAYRDPAQSSPTTVNVDSIKEVDLPAEVREELRNTGYVEPPARVSVVRVRIDDLPAYELLVEAGRSGNLLHDSIAVVPSEVQLQDALKVPAR